jgi:hypothetical protein
LTLQTGCNFEFPEAPGLVDPHAAVFLAPAVDGLLGDAQLLDHLGDGLALSLQDFSFPQFADLVVLDQNLFEVEARDISETKALLTLFERQPVFVRLVNVAARNACAGRSPGQPLRPNDCPWIARGADGWAALAHP